MESPSATLIGAPSVMPLPDEMAGTGDASSPGNGINLGSIGIDRAVVGVIKPEEADAACVCWMGMGIWGGGGTKMRAVSATNVSLSGCNNGSAMTSAASAN
jgi:hypothetical protein